LKVIIKSSFNGQDALSQIKFDYMWLWAINSNWL